VDRPQILEISRDRRGVVIGKVMEIEPRHAPKTQQTVRRPPIAEGVDDLRFCPLAYAGFLIRGQIARDVHAMRISSDSHSAGEIEIVATIDAGAVDLRVAQPTHLRVHKILAAVNQIDPLPRPVESTSWLPRRYTRKGLHIADEIPALAGREPLFVGGHGIANAGGQTEPYLIRIAASPEGPRRRKIANRRRVIRT